MTTLRGATGGVQTFRVTSTRANSGVKPEWYVKPGSAAAGDYKNNDNGGDNNRGSVRFDVSGGGGGGGAEVRVEKARSSHVLVRPLINGIDVGPFILDTGASGLVISKNAAEKLRLRAFGEVFVSGVAGKVPCQFRRADTLSLGPVIIDDPVFMVSEGFCSR